MSVWQSVVGFIKAAFSENGQPSSSRLTSTWLSLSSMSLIWFIFHHMMSQPVEKLQVWMGNLPMVIGALATFSTAPYGIGKLTGMFKHDDHHDDPDPKDGK
jgi:hypothetical protein